MEGTAGGMDKAQWSRFSKTGGRCLVCGERAVCSITLTSVELTGEKGGTQLARESIPFCQPHGLTRYADALMKLRGTGKI